MYTFKDFIRNLPRPPSKEQRAQNPESLNPWKLITALTPMQGLLFASGYFAWMMDAVDFFSVSLTANRLGESFGRSTHDITTAITLTLLLRSAGALIFGLISDRYGRKWPLIVDLLCIAVLELGTGFVNTYGEFLAVRSLFGIFMGGIWGLATATGLENMPIQCRGFFSGILQQGYAVGYLLAAVINLTLVEDTDNWRTLFYLGAGLSLAAAIFRLVLPESEVFLRAKAAGDVGNKGKRFMSELKLALKQYWLRAIYVILLMTGFNFFSHASQDLLPVYYQNQKGFTAHDASILTIIGNCGAVAGGLVAGYMSQFLGRRLAIIIYCIFAGVFLPLFCVPNGFSALAAGVFMVQVGVQGSWGCVPIYLSELSPPQFRAAFTGLAYQLGNMASSASAQIEATSGESARTINVYGQEVPNYALILGAFVGVVAAYIIILCLVGPEEHGSHFEEGVPAHRSGGETDEKGNRRFSVPDAEQGYTGEKTTTEKVEKAQRH